MVLVVAVLVLAAPLAIEAQQAGKFHRIGVLEVVDAAANAANLSAFRQGLSELGYVEGRNLVIEYRSADGRAERLSDLATELVRLKVDVIVTRGTPAALAAKRATQTIAIVMASSGDPVAEGIVASEARPGGNVTGLHIVGPPERGGKRLQLLKEAVPASLRIGILWNPGDLGAPLVVRDTERTARAMGAQPGVPALRLLISGSEVRVLHGPPLTTGTSRTSEVPAGVWMEGRWRLIRHAPYFVFQLAESSLTGSLFRRILQRIKRLGLRRPQGFPEWLLLTCWDVLTSWRGRWTPSPGRRPVHIEDPG